MENINTWKAALRADVRSFLAEEPNTPPDAEEDDGRKEDLDKDDDVEVESGWECCAPLSSPTWLSCEKKKTRKSSNLFVL